jgi:hypothetical protein
VFLWVGTLFIQSYIYTEATPGLPWQAPAAGLVLGAFLGLWCYIVATSPDAEPTDIPYDTLFRFSPKVEMFEKPAAQLWAVKKNDEKVRYKRFPVVGPPYYEYRDTTDAKRAWPVSGVKAIELEHDGEKYRFEPTVTERGAYPSFVNEKGWTMKVYDRGPTGIPTTFRTSRFLAMHLAFWFVCLWLLLRFQWSHALGIAFCAWLVFTIALLPMLLTYAAEVAQRQRPGSAAATATAPLAA